MKILSHLLTLAVLLLMAGLTACSGDAALSVYLEANSSRLNQSAASESRPVEFAIEAGTPARQIAEDLEQAGVIDDALLFEAYVRVNGLASKLEAGQFVLSPNMTIPEIAEALQNALAPGIGVTVRPGWRRCCGIRSGSAGRRSGWCCRAATSTRSCWRRSSAAGWCDRAGWCGWP